MVERPNTIWRDFATAGVSSSGAHKPRKAEIRAWGEYIQAFLNAGNFLGYTTKAALDADLAHAAGSLAIVYGESALNDGLYLKSGASGAGSWARIGGVPGFSFETAVDDGGTANAILATTAGDVNSTRLIALPIEITNTATPVTVAFNGGAALTIKTASGNNPAVGGLVAGTVLIGYGDGTNFRLLSDQASAAIQAAAEAAQAAAETAQTASEEARDLAQDYASNAVDASGLLPRYASVATLIADTDIYYSGGTGAYEVSTGVKIWAGEFVYEVAASGASDHQITTAGGVKLYVLPDQTGYYNAVSLGLCSGSNVATAYAAFVNAGLTKIRVPKHSTMVLSSALSLTNANDIELDVGGTIDCSGGGVINILGSHVTLPALSASTIAGANSVAFASAHGLAVGDVVCFWAGVDFSGGLARDYYHEGWRGEVARVDSSTQVTFMGTIECALDHTVFNCSKVVGGRFVLSGDGEIIPNTTTTPTIKIHRRNGIVLGGIKIPAGAGNSNIEVVQCYDITVNPLRSDVRSGDAYPISLNSCQKGVVNNVTGLRSSRHAYGIGGGGYVVGDTEGNTPLRGFVFNGCIFSGYGEGIPTADMHGAVFNTIFNNCVMDAALGFNGGDNTANNCTIYGVRDGAGKISFGVYMNEITGGYFRLNNCELITTLPSTSGFGVIYLIPTFATRDISLELNNCTWRHIGAASDVVIPIVVNYNEFTWDASGGTYPSAVHGRRYKCTVGGTVGAETYTIGDYIVYTSYGATWHRVPDVKVRVVVNNASVWGLTAVYPFLSVPGTVDATSLLTINIDRITSDITGLSAYVYCSSATNNNCVMTLPKQTVKAAASTTTGIAEVATSALTYPWGYPRRPGLLGVDAAPAFNGTYNQSTIGMSQVYVSNLATTSLIIKFQRISLANWGAALDFTLSATVGLSELG